MRDLGLRGQQADIGIEPRGHRVVIPGPQVSIAPHLPVRIAPHQQAELAMRLAPHNAVEHPHPRILQLARPAYVRVLIEARHQLHHHRHFLRLRRLNQRAENRRVLRRPVERLLHRHHRPIVRARADKVLHGRIIVERMVQQHIMLPQLRKQVLKRRRRLVRAPRKRRKLQPRQRRVAVQVHQPVQVHRPIGAKHLPRVELKVHPQPFHNLIVGSILNLQPHRIALAPVVQLLAYTFEHRPRLLLLQVEIAVARHPERRHRQHLVPAKHLLYFRFHQLMQKDVVRFPYRGRQANQPRQRPWNRYHTQHRRLLRPLRTARHMPLVPQQQRQAQRLVQHARKRVRGIDGHRRQQRVYLVGVEPVRMRARLFRQLLVPQHTHALLLQRRQQLVVPACVLRLHQRRHAVADARQPLLRQQPAFIRLDRLTEPVFNPLQHPRHANLDELIQV